MSHQDDVIALMVCNYSSAEILNLFTYNDPCSGGCSSQSSGATELCDSEKIKQQFVKENI